MVCRCPTVFLLCYNMTTLLHAVMPENDARDRLLPLVELRVHFPPGS